MVAIEAIMNTDKNLKLFNDYSLGWDVHNYAGIIGDIQIMLYCKTSLSTYT